jgi:hypothetical protein
MGSRGVRELRVVLRRGLPIRQKQCIALVVGRAPVRRPASLASAMKGRLDCPMSASSNGGNPVSIWISKLRCSNIRMPKRKHEQDIPGRKLCQVGAPFNHVVRTFRSPTARCARRRRPPETGWSTFQPGPTAEGSILNRGYGVNSRPALTSSAVLWMRAHVACERRAFSLHGRWSLGCDRRVRDRPWTLAVELKCQRG